MKCIRTKHIKLMIALFALILGPIQPALATTPSIEKMWQTIQQQQKTIDELKAKLEKTEQRTEENSAQVKEAAEAIDTTADAIEQSNVATTVDKVRIGGYGELHYNNLDADDSVHDKDEIDFHRFVLFFSYEFNDKLNLFSELELEHSLAGDGDDKPGEIELEQAFIEYDFDDYNTGRIGLFLLPVGILNETHEPPTFYGVERNNIENVIIPSTWWAGGIGYSHRADNGLSLDVAIHEGLKVPADTNARIRSGRQKTAEADAEDFAGTARLKYTGVLGLELAAALQYQSDISQNGGDGLGSATLFEAHGIYNIGPFGIRALYARWDMGTKGTAGQLIENAGSDEQDGWYIEPSFKITEDVGIFTRYEDVEGGRTRDRFDQWVLGVNYWINEDVVLKADYVNREHDVAGDSGKDLDGFNLGFGYQF